MNTLSYKLIFSTRHGALIAVHEQATSGGKAASGERTLRSPNSSSRLSGFGAGCTRLALAALPAALAVGLCFSGNAMAQVAANTLPNGGQVGFGSASIGSNAGKMQINQSSDRASINWTAFSIGKDASVNINQPGSSAILLNRVTGSDASQILGRLSANGQVILVNPNGIVFGQGSAVNAAGFTAGTKDILDADFQKGTFRFAGSSTAEVKNQGSITVANGGYVVLMGATVTNDGKISAPQGSVALVSAGTVTLPSAISVPVGQRGKITLELSPSAVDASVVNTKSGLIQTAGGDVLLQASALNDAMASVKQSGMIDSSANHGGAVTLLANNGTIVVDGSINASSAAGIPGADIVIGRDSASGQLAAHTDVRAASLTSTGGFVETSGHQLDFGGAQVTASQWLLDPTDVTINSAEALSISSSLSNGTSITIKTDGSSALGNGAAGDGNITVNNDITMNAASAASTAKLSLQADNGIHLNADIRATSGVLDVDLQGSGIATLASNSKGITLAAGKTISTSGDVTINGVTKNSASNVPAVLLNAGSSILARNITITGTASGASNTNHGIQSKSSVALTASNDIKLTGSTGQGSSVKLSDGTLTSTAGTITIKGTTNGTAGGGVNMDGQSIQARNNVNISSTVTNSSSQAIYLGRTSSHNNPTLNSDAGDVLLQSNQGFIQTLGLDRVSGRNITIDNTGGSLQGGAYVPGNGVSTASQGVYLVTGPFRTTATQFVASGDVNVIGSAAAGSGTSSGVVLDAALSTPGKLNVVGTTSAASAYGVDASGKYASITASAGGANQTGSNAITVAGNNTNAAEAGTAHGVLLGKVVNQSTGGNTSITSAASGITGVDGGSVVNAASAGSIKLAAGVDTASQAVVQFLTTGYTLTQNSNGGVEVSTTGQGNVTPSKIVNNGNGDVKVAAGKLLPAGNGSGGQVDTVAGNTISSNGSGKIYVSSGAAAATGALANLNPGFNTLFYNGTSNTINSAFNKPFDSPIAGTNVANVQALFREPNSPDFAITLPSSVITKTSGAKDPTAAEVNSALNAAYTGPALLTKAVNKNNFAVAAKDVIAALSGTRQPGESVGTYAYSLASNMNTTVSGQPKLQIVANSDPFVTPVTPSNNPIQPVAPAIPSGTPARNINFVGANEGFALAGLDECSPTNVEGCFCEELPEIQSKTKTVGLEICYDNNGVKNRNRSQSR